MSLTIEARAPVAARLERAFRRPRVVGLISGSLFGSHAEEPARGERDVNVGVLFDRAAHLTPQGRRRALERDGTAVGLGNGVRGWA